MNTLCESCKGRGQKKSAETIVTVVDGKSKTIQLGSGCPECLGTGIKGERN